MVQPELHTTSNNTKTSIRPELAAFWIVQMAGVVRFDEKNQLRGAFQGGSLLGGDGMTGSGRLEFLHFLGEDVSPATDLGVGVGITNNRYGEDCLLLPLESDWRMDVTGKIDLRPIETKHVLLRLGLEAGPSFQLAGQGSNPWAFRGGVTAEGSFR